MQAKSQGNSDTIDRLDVRCRLMELQQRLVSNLEASCQQVRNQMPSICAVSWARCSGISTRHMIEVASSVRPTFLVLPRQPALHCADVTCRCLQECGPAPARVNSLERLPSAMQAPNDVR